MIELMDVFFIAANISSAADCREFWMISSVTGSFVLVAISGFRPCLVEFDQDIAKSVHADLVARMYHDRHARILDDCGPLEPHPRLQEGAIVEGRGMDALEGVVHIADTLHGNAGIRSRLRSLGDREPPRLRGGHEMNPDHLHRSIEPVRVFALVRIVKRGFDPGNMLLADFREADLHIRRMLLVLVPKPSISHESQPFRGNPLVLELPARQILDSRNTASIRSAEPGARSIRRVTK